MRIAGLMLVLAIVNSSAFPQDKIVTKANQQWLQYYNQTRVSDRWLLLIDGGYRWSDGFTERFQYLMRAAAGYEVGKAISVSAGFGYWGTFTGSDVSSSEFRPHQDLTLKHAKGKLSFNHRLRIEQRFIKSTSNSNLEFDQFNWRFRYYIGLLFPIKEFSKPGMTLNFSIGDELFINAGKEIVYNIFDHNRILIGPMFDLNSNLTIGLVYQGQYRALNLATRYIYSHIMWFSIRHRMDLTKHQGTPP